jgi:predicted nucleic acid-binding protein
MTVLDCSAVVDYLLGTGAADEVEGILEAEGPAAAPDLLVFEVLAVFRRDVRRGVMDARRASGAVEDLGDLWIEYFPTAFLRERAWELRENLTAADALYAALAEWLGEPLATKDRGLAAVASRQLQIETVEL